MSKLKQIQQQFCTALIDQPNEIAAFSSSSHIEKRMAIYRATVWENLKNTLFLIFPGIWQLVGESCANSVALTFIKNKKHLPRPGELDNWASEFPAFLSAVAALKELPYLTDFAQYEWLKHQAYHADNESALTIQALEKIPEEKSSFLKVAFLSSVYFLQSSYPLQKIQALLENPDCENVDLNEGNSYCLIARIEDEIKLFWIEKNLWLFLKNVK